MNARLNDFGGLAIQRGTHDFAPPPCDGFAFIGLIFLILKKYMDIANPIIAKICAFGTDFLIFL
jgi:hypothetical protein